MNNEEVKTNKEPEVTSAVADEFAASVEQTQPQEIKPEEAAEDLPKAIIDPSMQVKSVNLENPEATVDDIIIDEVKEEKEPLKLNTPFLIGFIIFLVALVIIIPIIVSNMN